MKFVKLLTAAYVAGVLRHPHEGTLSVADEEAGSLIAGGVAEDVTDDFGDEQIAAAQAEPITTNTADLMPPAQNLHQAEVETDTPTKPPARKPAASKE